MDKNAIKKYAVWARRELISRVSQKALQYGISEKEIVPASAASVNGVVLSAEEIKQRKALIDQINTKGYEQVMEEVAYTWFNRFIALRFMEVNGYLPSHVRVFTDEDNAFKPQIITEAINLELDGLDMDKVYAWKDANDNDSLFKYLIITQCNALSPILPRMFQRIADYTELLFPDNLLREGSAIQQMIELIPEDDWKDAVQIIGWLYQYYNTDVKAKVFARPSSEKIKKEDIPAATQLFTPDWIVRYMVENSLGRLWMEHLSASGEGYHYCYDTNGNSVASSAVTSASIQQLKSNWKYYVDEAAQEPEVQAHLATIRKEYATIAPEQIKCIDPCAGSGHILAYMFDVLVQIYENYGYSVREAVRSIVDNNLYGLDIDNRASQLAYFSVMMKARQYDRRFMARKDEYGNPDVPQPRVYAICESDGIDQYALDYFCDGDAGLKNAMDSIIKEFHEAKEYGSILNITPVDFSALYKRFDEVSNEISISRETVLRELLPLVQVAEVLCNKYSVVVTNPPYMGSNGMGNKLSDYIRTQYPDSKSDFFSVFIEKCFAFSRDFCAMVTPVAWMYNPRYVEFREKNLEKMCISSLVELGDDAFEAGFGTTMFTMCKKYPRAYKATFYDVALIEDKERFKQEHPYVESSATFVDSADKKISYKLSKQVRKVIRETQQLQQFACAGSGLQTNDNARFIHDWFEVNVNRIDFTHSAQGSYVLGKRWYPTVKNTSSRKWYGNFSSVVNWEDDGREIKQLVAEKYGSYTRHVKNERFYFCEGLTWSHSTYGKPFALRYLPAGFISNVEGPAVFQLANKTHYMLGLLNSKVAVKLFELTTGSIHILATDVAKFPCIINETFLEKVNALVTENIAYSKQDWDAYETSWDFWKHPLVPTQREWEEQRNSQFADTRAEKFSLLSWHYDQWVYECQYRFDSLKENEEELNRIFIDIYGLQDELTPEVDSENITVNLADKASSVRSLISYAVGCMFGRYSLDVPGLAYAGGEWDDSKYTTFKADKDSIIPICDDDYFADDIVNRFVRFIEVVYGKDTLNENLRFIAEALGGSGQPKEVIRNYFLNDFYADHLKVYQKRPIYWLFDSGKKSGFKALVYMHRYAPDTIARMRTDYVHEQQARYRTAIADLEQRIASASTAERVKLSKRLKTLQEQATEIQSYEEKIHHLADQYIAIDLDDGVKKNYAIFGDVLAKIK